MRYPDVQIKENLTSFQLFRDDIFQIYRNPQTAQNNDDFGFQKAEISFVINEDVFLELEKSKSDFE